MAAILLTRNNIDFLKAETRGVLRAVKSSHLTEALAFGLGYRTHAALLAEVGRTDPARPLLGYFDPDRLSERLISFGQTAAHLNEVKAVTRSFNLPDRIWTRFPHSDLATNNRWYRECQKRNIPNVCIKTRRKYVELYWDCISIDSRDEAHVQGERGDALVREMFQTFKTIASRVRGKAEFFGNSITGTVDNLLPELAEDMADAFFAMLYEPMRQRRLAAA